MQRTENVVMNSFSWKIAGAAGDGILNAGLMLARMCLRAGMVVFASAEYPSLIRGGHNHLDVHVSEQQIHSHTQNLTILVAMNRESVEKHASKIVEGGAIIYDPDETVVGNGDVRDDVRLCPVPLMKLATQCGGKIMRNVVAMGATLALLDADIELFNNVLRQNFGAKKGQDVVAKNIDAARLGYEHIKKATAPFPYRLEARKVKSRIFLSGNEAISIGAIKAGCKFFAAYPMTPASSVLHVMAANEKNFNMVVKHTEDEIAAINMVVGAAHAGVRAMTSTSGGGFALMCEGFGLAAQTETPIVVVEAQRPGPATGMATHSGQGDLRFMLHASTDEFPRIVVAPGDVSECYYTTIDVFNLAEKYQLPAIIMTDKFLGESFHSVEEFSSHARIERGALLSDDEIANTSDYRRYKITESGVSPRALPGQKGGEYTASSYEHTEEGMECELESVRVAMHDKRFRKMESLSREVVHPSLVGDANTDITFISWGSPKGPIKDAMALLKKAGVSSNYYQVLYLSPFPNKQIADVIASAKLSVVVENNKTSLLSGLIREQTGLAIEHHILKYDGRPFWPEEIAHQAAKIMQQHKAAKTVR